MYICCRHNSTDYGDRQPWDCWRVWLVALPVVEVNPSTQAHTAGQSTTINCHASGRPQPHIAWQLNEQDLQSSDLSHSHYLLTGKCAAWLPIKQATIRCTPSVRLSRALVKNKKSEKFKFGTQFSVTSLMGSRGQGQGNQTSQSSGTSSWTFFKLISHVASTSLTCWELTPLKVIGQGYAVNRITLSVVRVPWYLFEINRSTNHSYEAF